MLVSSTAGAILVDVTRDFARQARAVERIDRVLITHAHRDACGGLPQLERWLAAPVPLASSRATVRAIRARYRRLDHLALEAVASGASVAWRGWRLTALEVPHAEDCTTFAWRLARGGLSIVYASDVARLTPALAALCGGCDLLVLDGAMWGRRLFSHLEIQATVPLVARWPVRRVLLTQLGRSTPAHAALDRWLRAFDPRFGAAYDGLVVELAPHAPAR